MAISFQMARRSGLAIMFLLIVIAFSIPSIIVIRISGPNSEMSNRLSKIQKAIEIEELFDKAKSQFDLLPQKKTNDTVPIIRAIVASISASQNLLEKIPDENKEEKVLVQNFINAGRRFRAAVYSYTEERDYDPAGDTAVEMEKIATDAVEDAHKTLVALIKDIQKNIQINKSVITDRIKEGQVFSLVGLFGGLLCGLIVSFITSRALRSPIQQLLEGTQKVTEGKLTHYIPVNSKDEIGQLTAAFNEMAEELSVNEAMLKKTNIELVANEQRLRSVLSAITHPIYIIDANDYSVELLNFAAKELAGQNEFDKLKCYQMSHQANHPCSSTEHPCPLKKVVETKKAVILEHTHVDKNGKTKIVELHVFPIFNDDGEVVQVVESCIDITERKQGEEERIRLEKELGHAQKLKSIGTLAAGIAHEINTPIQFIGDNTQFAIDAVNALLQTIDTYKELFANENQNEIIAKGQALRDNADLIFYKKELPLSLEQILEGTSRVANIVRAMKDFSYMGADKKSPEDINKAIETTITISRNEWKYVSDLETHLDASLPLINCSIGNLKQVMLNLIVNAAHSIEESMKKLGKKKGLITIRTSIKEKDILIAVEDTGMGIPEEIRHNVFDHFFTTKEIGKGTGQGLSIAYQTVTEKHGGRIWFDTEIGRGTTFFITLPIAG